MNKKLVTLMLAAGIAVIFVATALYAGTEVGDVVTMESKIHKKRKYGPKSKKPAKLVSFSHKKHSEDFTCGECHHDDKGQPLELKKGDDVQKCEACHNRTKAKEKTFESYKSKPDKKKMVDIKVHKTALHENCIGCHVKKGVKSHKTCKQCHVKI